MNKDAKSLLDAVEGSGLKDRRSLSRAISLVEDGNPKIRQELSERFSRTGGSNILGITGAPGAGKSTLVDLLAQELCAAGGTVAVIAVDPSSPYSGGALLGDRIRMGNSAANEKIYIRSMATRGALGGLAHSTREVIFLLELAKFDHIILETVGVGQAEVDIVKTADTVGLVLVPGMGDGVQALKAGIIEIADLFIINKADYPATDRLYKELRHVIGLAPEHEIEPQIVKTIASKGEGIGDVLAECAKHRQNAQDCGLLKQRKEEFLLQALQDAFMLKVRQGLMQSNKGEKLRSKLEKLVCNRELSPDKAAERLLESLSLEDS